jgi:MFS family permease
MQSVAMGWLVVSRLNGSGAILGVVGFSSQIPSLLLGPLAGVISDRFNRRSILLVTQTLAMIQAFILSALVLRHVVTVWHIVALSVFLGIIMAFDAPTRQAFVFEMTDSREDLPNAIALNSSMFNGARLVGPSIAGPVVAAFGEGICFLLNGISYLAVIASLLAMRLPPKRVEATSYSPLKGLIDGFSYTFGFQPIRAILTLVALTSFAGMPYTMLMPIFAKRVFGGSANTLGILLASAGAGALVGAILLAARKSVVGLGKWIVIGTTTFGLALIVFSFSRVLWFSCLMVFIGGMGMMAQMASCNTVLQTIVEEHMRGRAMSFYTMSFLGVMPFGSLAAGFLADHIGPARTVSIGGIVCLICAAVFSRKLPVIREMITPIYMKLGIIRESQDCPGQGAKP